MGDIGTTFQSADWPNNLGFLSNQLCFLEYELIKALTTFNVSEKDFQIIVDNAKTGLVLFSLGTNVPFESLGDERITLILNAFRKLPQYTFLCKFDLEKPPVPVPGNVIMRKWIPQNDVLGIKFVINKITNVF